jgi:hypothetical protein
MTTGPEFLFDASPQLREFCLDIVAEMMVVFDISKAEAVARINCHWRGHTFARHNDLVMHAPPEYWASIIYFKEIFEDDRLQRIPRPAPSRDSGCWTMS